MGSMGRLPGRRRDDTSGDLSAAPDIRTRRKRGRLPESTELSEASLEDEHLPDLSDLAADEEEPLSVGRR